MLKLKVLGLRLGSRITRVTGGWQASSELACSGTIRSFVVSPCSDDKCAVRRLAERLHCCLAIKPTMHAGTKMP